MGEGAPEPLKLRFGGSLIEQLGAQLYPSATATIAELISNAWDADAGNVWVTILRGRPRRTPDRLRRVCGTWRRGRRRAQIGGRDR